MKIARIRDNAEGETYALLSPDGSKLVTRSEIQEQTGIPLPLSVKDFMFNEWIKEVIDYQSQLHYSMRLDALELLAPLPNPPTIICLAFNYYDHAKDAGLMPSDEPVIFIKPRTALNSPYSDIICPTFVRRLDYEAEIAVVIGKRRKKCQKMKP